MLMPMSPDPYYIDIEIDVVHRHPATYSHPGFADCHAAHAIDIHAAPPAAAEVAPEAKPALVPTDPSLQKKRFIVSLIFNSYISY